MNFKKVLKVFLVIGVLCLLAVASLTSSPSVAGAEPSHLADGHYLRVIIITDAGGPNSVFPSRSVRARFAGIVNSGKYNIVQTKTVWRKGKMVAAEIYHLVGPSIEPLSNNSAGKGYCLRVKIITDSGGGPNSVVPSRSVRARFKEIVNSGRYDVVRTRTVYRAGKMVAAEIYYQAPNCPPRVEPLEQ